MAKPALDELLDAFKEMTPSGALGLREEALEEVFEVTAAALVAALRRRGCRCSGRGRRGAVGVRRHPRGCRRQEDRRHQGRPRDRLRPGPKEAKDLSTALPSRCFEKVTKEAAEDAKGKPSEAAGATVTVK